MTSNLQGSPEWTAKSVRDTFIEFFQKNGHTFGTPQTNIFSILVSNRLANIELYFQLPLPLWLLTQTQHCFSPMLG
jgi:hypothetical protein